MTKSPKSPEMNDNNSTTPFQNRDEELGLVMAMGSEMSLINFYGVTGIGKSRLLQEAAQRLCQSHPETLMIQVDVSELPDSTVRYEGFLQAIIDHDPTRLRGIRRTSEQVAAEVVVKLNEIADQIPSEAGVFLFVDTTESAQDDMSFWGWLEEHLVGPLVVSGRVRQIFVGRVPVPWRRFEVRRAVKLHSLDPLSPEDAAKDLIVKVLRLNNPDLSVEQATQIAPLLTDLSFGHPLLSEQLAAETASQVSKALEQPGALQRELGGKVVQPFINSYLFGSIPELDPWPTILRWASVLHEFDPLLLRRYLEKLEPTLVAGKPDYFFIQGLSRLRIQHTLVWNAGEGTAVYGILRDILRQNLRILRPEDFKRACLAAAAVYDELADEFAPASAEAERYHQEAEQYRMESRTIDSPEEEK